MSDFKETCIWMSYRYAIGRKSIASVSHARDIARHLDWIPDNRKEFTGKDMMKEINDKLNWYPNVHFESFNNDTNDAFSIIFKWFMDNPQEDPVKFFQSSMWYINVDRGEIVAIDDYTGEINPYLYNIFSDYSDFEDWIKLANMLLNKTKKVTIEYEGKIETRDCYSWIDCKTYGNKVELDTKYADVSRGFPTWYIAPEFITSIE